jgi:hypothetical protein
MRRPRGPGGRFLTAVEIAEMDRLQALFEAQGGVGTLGGDMHLASNQFTPEQKSAFIQQQVQIQRQQNQDQTSQQQQTPQQQDQGQGQAQSQGQVQNQNQTQTFPLPLQHGGFQMVPGSTVQSERYQSDPYTNVQHDPYGAAGNRVYDSMNPVKPEPLENNTQAVSHHAISSTNGPAGGEGGRENGQHNSPKKA